jgi:ATP-dependent DNA helicase RecG
MGLLPNTSPPPPDWVRVQKALSLEAEQGFSDLQGRESTFSEYLARTLQEPVPLCLPVTVGDRWQSLAQQYQSYSTLSMGQRQQLVAETRRVIYQTQQDYRRAVEPPSAPRERRPATQPLQPQVKGDTPRSQSNGGRPALDQPLTYLPGIGPKNAERLARLGLYSVRDLLFYFPRNHLDYARQIPIRQLEEGKTVTLIATVRRCGCFDSPRNPKLTIFELVAQDGTGQIRLSRFYAGTRFRNRGWQDSQRRLYPPGAIIAASGLVKRSKYGLTLEDPEIEVLDHSQSKIESFKIGRVVPVYPLTEGIQPDLVRRAVIAALPAAQQLQDVIPPEVLEENSLIALSQAIELIHYPTDAEALARARQRLVFDEFFYLQLGLLKRRQDQRRTQQSRPLQARGELVEKFYALLPFAMTGAQQRVIQDILVDLGQSTPMNRLVQGDVGAGKTVVAVVALLAAIQSGFQAALMAPTEVLAEQHYRKLVEWFNPLHLPVELLTGSTKAAKRRQVLTQLQTGELPLLVGTHALIQNPVEFQRLGLVVIDEQHRFGVHQRAQLQQKGDNPHVLTMTATPIPRTLALTLHGDLEVSQIDELPPGRQAIKTTVLAPRDRPHAYDLMRREIAQGRQIYIVLPLVEESEKLDLKSAVEEHQRLREVIFPDFSVGLLHGRLSSGEKDDVISQFRRGELHILVSTTVVEVGVDIPNATVMLIEHAERFGLAQLHQLRGRVGRGAHQSFCLLLNSSKGDGAKQRLAVLEQSQDGFFISEMDLRFRGPGEVLGTRQSGLPDFALASLVEDQSSLELSRQTAERLIAMDPSLERWPLMLQELLVRYQRLMGGSILT